MSLAGRPPAGLSVRVLLAEPIVAVLPVGHRLAGRAAVTLADLADEPFVDSPPGYGNRTEVDPGSPPRGCGGRVALEVADIATVQQYVRNGLGVALIPRFSVTAGAGLSTCRSPARTALDVRGGDRLGPPVPVPRSGRCSTWSTPIGSKRPVSSGLRRPRRTKRQGP